MFPETKLRETTGLEANRRICVYCDNKAVVAILSAKSSNYFACDEPCTVDHFGLILHLLLSMSRELIMALLIVCLVSRCPDSAFSHQMHRQHPVRSLHFLRTFNHASCSLYFAVYCNPYLSHLPIRRAPFYAILPFTQPYFL